jgi:hypothetical protein
VGALLHNTEALALPRLIGQAKGREGRGPKADWGGRQPRLLSRGAGQLVNQAATEGGGTAPVTQPGWQYWGDGLSLAGECGKQTDSEAEGPTTDKIAEH